MRSGRASDVVISKGYRVLLREFDGVILATRASASTDQSRLYLNLFEVLSSVLQGGVIAGKLIRQLHTKLVPLSPHIFKHGRGCESHDPPADLVKTHLGLKQ